VTEPRTDTSASATEAPRVPARLELHGLYLEEEVEPGADLAQLLISAAERAGRPLRTDDVAVVAQKVVSKAEGRLVRLADVEPSRFAERIAAENARDSRLIELVLRESRRIVRMDRGIIIAETHHGFVCANAGIDLSNVAGGSVACLLPVDPDRSARELRAGVERETGVAPAVVISDTFGRPWRTGATNVALGVAGLGPIRSHLGERDPYGYELRATEVAAADELAAAAELVMGKTDRRPFVLIGGFPGVGQAGEAQQLVRDSASDLFR
jgi:coenzyme F420-0:L-glutamate ligase/coenzyme F420-1:gamma-L-glutamate ligase